MGIYDKRKLPGYTFDFHNRIIADLGAGAVGSHIVEKANKAGIKNVYVVDFDKLEAGNYAKSSSLYQYPEDVGESKALALAKRANAYLDSESVFGINANVTNFGPMAFAGMDAILAPFDNYAAKVYINQQWLQIPLDIRPELFWGGTWDEEAQSNELDGTGPCLRCCHDEKWFANPLVRTSCTGPNYRNPDMPAASGITTGLASDFAAGFMVEQLRARFLNMEEAANKRIMYTPFPNLRINVNTPMKRKNCPDCNRFQPPVTLEVLENCDVMTLTMKALFTKLRDALGTTDFSVSVPRIDYAEATYTELIVDDYCRCCGKLLKGLYTHEFKQRYEDLLCADCRSAGKKTSDETRTTLIGTKMNVIKPEELQAELANRTLFSLGWTIGGFIKVYVRKAGIDIMDEDFGEEYTFYCGGDQKLLKTIKVLEG